jgi:IMP dehydrogenase
MPDDVSTETRFSRNVKLKIPIVSAAMDTVTESKMAIGIAKLGGLGVIHKNMGMGEQAAQVAKVKHHLNGLISKPIVVSEDEPVSAILARIEEKGYSFRSFPVLDKEGRVAGLLSGNDFDFCSETALLARDLMTKEFVHGDSRTDITQSYELMRANKKKVLPLLDNGGRLTGLYIFSDVKRIMTGKADMFNTDARNRLRVAAAIGTGPDAIKRAAMLIGEDVDVIVIDTAHGDSGPVIETLAALKKEFPGIDAVVGNVSVGESVKRLADAGADGIKVGQGPGSICTTRIIAGIGRPQVSAIYECAKVADEYGIPVCGDGGISSSGDIAVAIGAGASSVMLGNMLAGVDEAPGEIMFIQGKPSKSYRGMGSLGAMAANKGSRERYNQRDAGKDSIVPEGVEGIVPYKGTLKEVMVQYVGGLKRGMGYVGAATIEELREKGDFDMITNSGLRESHPHDITITKDSPNYKGTGRA